MKHILQKRPYRVRLALWVDCCRLAIAFINASFVLCVKYSREWSSNEISKLFVTEFNARVNWIRPATRVGDKAGNQSLPRTFYAILWIFKKMLCWSMFHVKTLNKLPITCILNRGPCFCTAWFNVLEIVV